MYSAWFRSTFLTFLKFLDFKVGGANSWGEPILQNVWIIWSSLLCLNFKSFLNQNSSSFIRFQWILHDLGIPFSHSWYFYKLKTGNLISQESLFCRMSELFGPPCCISIFKVVWTQLFCHSLYFSHCCMSQQYFSKSPKMSTN